MPEVELAYAPKGADSNSYLSLDEAEVYFSTRLNSSVWNLIEDTDTKKMALIAACRRMESELDYVGEATTTTQALKLPRAYMYNRNRTAYLDKDVIAQVFKDAQCEQAAAELASDLNATSSIRGISDVQVSTIWVRFDPNKSTDSGPVVVKPVWTLLKPWLLNSYNTANRMYSVNLERV